MKKFLSVLGVLLIAALAALPAPAQAAMWVGVELGPNFMANSDVKVDFSGDINNSRTYEYRWNTKVLGGITFGYHFINQGFLAYNWPDWMKYFQFAIDFSYHTIEAGPRRSSTEEFQFHVSRLKGDVFTVAFLFIGCYGFYPDSVAPFGRVVPYVGVGPALIQSWVSASGEFENRLGDNFNFNRTSTDIGLVAEAGVRFMALKNVSLDVAFRYRWTQPNYAFTTSPGPGPVNVKLGIRDAHLFNALVRASYHF